MKTQWGYRNSAWKFKSSWRSEYAWYQQNLSSSMKKALRLLVLPNEKSSKVVASRTLESLRVRRLVDATEELTDPGIVLSLSLLPLQEQCKFLQIDTQEIELAKKYEDPAVDAMYYFMECGNRCCYTEGGIVKKILFCLYFHKLSEYTKAGWKDFMSGLCTIPFAVGLNIIDFEDYVKNYATIEQNLIETIAEANCDIFLKNYRMLFKKGFCWFGVDEIFATEILEIIGIRDFAEIARVIFSDPYAFMNGWPDLTVIKNGNVEFVEVKTNDRFTISQLITIPEMINKGGITASVLRISRSSPTCRNDA